MKGTVVALLTSLTETFWYEKINCPTSVEFNRVE